MADKNSKIVAKPADQKEIASPPIGENSADEKKPKPQKYHYLPGEEPEKSSISSYGRGRMGTVYD